MEQVEAIPDVVQENEDFLAKMFGDLEVTADDIKRLYPKLKKFGKCPKCRAKLGSPQRVADHFNEGAHKRQRRNEMQ